MTDINALIERLEKATEPDRELDLEIWWHINPHGVRRAYWRGALGPPRDVGWPLPAGLGRSSALASVIPYTVSVDAALSLVPEGFGWMVQSGAYAQVFKHCGPWFDSNTKGHQHPPAIALCLAALRARAAQG